MTREPIVSDRTPATRRAILRAAGGIGLAAPAVLRVRRADAAGVLNITAYDGFIPPGFRRRFEAETGIEVRVRLASSQAPELNLLVAERPDPLTDICTVTGNRIPSSSTHR